MERFLQDRTRVHSKLGSPGIDQYLLAAQIYQSILLIVSLVNGLQSGIHYTLTKRYLTIHVSDDISVEVQLLSNKCS
jgi:hypothetical protein